MKKQTPKDIFFLTVLVLGSLALLVGSHVIKSDMSTEFTELQKKHMLVGDKQEQKIVPKPTTE